MPATRRDGNKIGSVQSSDIMVVVMITATCFTIIGYLWGRTDSARKTRAATREFAKISQTIQENAAMPGAEAYQRGYAEGYAGCQNNLLVFLDGAYHAAS